MAQVTIVPPTPQVQTLAAGGQQAQSATHTGVPTAAHLSPGALVSGVITGRDQGGGYMLKTDQGTFTLHSSAPLTYNSDVLIRVDSSNEGTAGARIVSVNGQAFSAFSAPAEQETDSISPSLLAKTGAENTQQLAATTDTPALNAAKAVTIQAITVAPPAASSTAETPQAPVPVGTSVTLNAPAAQNIPAAPIAETAPEIAQPQNAPTTLEAQPGTAIHTPQAPVPAPQLSAQSSAGLAPAPAAATLLPQTSTVNPIAATPQTAIADEAPANTATLSASQPQAFTTVSASASASLTPAPAVQPQSPGVQSTLYAAYAKSAAAAPVATLLQNGQPVVAASIISSNDDGTITLQTPQGPLTVQPEALPAEAQLTPGTPLSITLPASFAYLAQAGDAPKEDSITATLKQVLSLVQAKAPAASADLLARLPAMGSDFFSSSLTFMSALLQGNARKILGESTVDALHAAGADDVAEKFAGQTGATAQSLQQPAENADHTAAWQSLTLPFVYQGAVQEARLYVKRDAPRKEREGRKPVGDTRFILEITFDDLGELQLDGIVLPKENATVFDLMVRTQIAFMPEEKLEITQIYNNASELTGFKGTIGFSVAKDFPVRPLAEMHANPRDIIA